MIEIGLGGLLSAFKLAYDLATSKSEEERMKEGLLKAMKKFKFFYEDVGWSQIRNVDAYRPKLANMAEEIRTIAVQVDGVLDKQIVMELRRMAANLDAASSERLGPNIFTRAAGIDLKKAIETSYQISKRIISLLEKL